MLKLVQDASASAEGTTSTIDLDEYPAPEVTGTIGNGDGLRGLQGGNFSMVAP